MPPRFAAAELPSRHFQPRIYGVGAWTDHIYFAYDLIAYERPALLVELGTDRGESYFTFCQSIVENETGSRCFAIDTWRGDPQSGFYDETTFERVTAHNNEHYKGFSTLLRCSFDDAREQFAPEKIDILHLDGLHTEEAVQRDLGNWLPKLRPGGILLLHDVCVRTRDFGVWKAWDQLKQEGRWFTFEEGPGLGIWEKSSPRSRPFLDLFFNTTRDSAALAAYYRDRVRELREKIAEQWRTGKIRETAFAQETIIQVFYTRDGRHCEEDSLYTRIGHDDWKEVSIKLPPGGSASPLRIDFVSALTVIEISSLRLISSGKSHFEAQAVEEFNRIRLGGDVERLPHPNHLLLKITGIDPQLYLPALVPISAHEQLVLEVRLRVWPQESGRS
jgi:hypothetical protein